MPASPMPWARASVAKAAFQASKPAAELPQGAASLARAIKKRAATAAREAVMGRSDSNATPPGLLRREPSGGLRRRRERRARQAWPEVAAPGKVFYETVAYVTVIGMAPMKSCLPISTPE